MAYLTLDDLVARFGEREMLDVADRDDDGVVDAGVLAAAIGDAERDVDAQIGARYAVPLATVPDLVKRVAAQLARYYLHVANPPEWVRAGYKDALAILADIRDGRVAIDAPAAAGGASVAGRVQGVADARIFTPDRLRGF